MEPIDRYVRADGRKVYAYKCEECGKILEVIWKIKKGKRVLCKQCSHKIAAQKFSREDKKRINEKRKNTTAENERKLKESLSSEEYESYKREKQERKIKKRNVTLTEKYGSVENAWKCTSEKAKQTMLSKYGTSNVYQIPGVKEKVIAHNIEKYGVPSSSQSDAVKQKMKEGRKNVDESLALEKRNRTNLEKYGVPFAQQSEEIKETFRQNCLKKYGVDNPSKLEETRIKTHNTIIKIYGSWQATKTSEQKRLEKEKILQENLKKYEDIDFSTKGFEYSIKEKIPYVRCLNCEKEFPLIVPPSQIMTNLHCPFCNPKALGSQTEKDIVNLIKSWGLKIEENNRSILDGKELDIYVPSLNLAIEYDGSYWHQLGQKEKNYHLEKTNRCVEKNIRLIHIFDEEYMNKRELVIDLLKRITNQLPKIGARSCSIREINPSEYRDFLEDNHLQGASESSIRLGLFHNSRIVAVMGFSKPRFNKNYEYELVRYCEKSDLVVLGAKSKLLKYFEKNHNPKSIISYSDRRWFTGSSMKKLGFAFKHNTSPNYKYFKIGSYKFYSRNQFMKRKLSKLKDFDFHEELTEIENMQLNGYSLIYDCGNAVYVKEYKCQK